MKSWKSARMGFARTMAITFVLAGALSACSATGPMERSVSDEIHTEHEALSAERIANILELAESAMKEKRYSDARELLERAMLHEPGNMQLRLANAELLLASGYIHAAHEAFRNLAKEADEPSVRARARQGVGLAAILLDRPEEARAALEEALAEEGSLWRARNGLGILADRDGHWSQAEAHYTKALEAAPGSATLHNNRGYSRLLQGRANEAIKDFEAALQANRDFPSARENIRLAYAWKGRYAFATAGMNQRDKPRVLNNIGYVALLRGDYANAEAYLQQAVEADARYNKIAHENMAYLKNLEAHAEDASPSRRGME